MILNFIFIGLFFPFNNQNFVYSISCRGQTIDDVDWWVVYKAPEQGSNYKDKKEYFYHSSGEVSNNWLHVPSDFADESSKSVVQKTFEPLYKNGRGYNYISYNDIPPTDIFQTLAPKPYSKSYGEGKGVLAWNKDGGIFVMHSMPAFPSIFLSRTYSVPKTPSSTHGHMFMCVHVNLETVKKILIHLVIMKVKVYDIFLLNDDGRTMLKNAQDKVYDSKIIKKMFKRSQKTNIKTSRVLQTVGGESFRIITKQYKQTQTIWERLQDYISHNEIYIKSSNYISTVLKPNLDCKNKLSNVLGIDIKINDEESRKWTAQNDDSKWGICSKDAQMKCFCISDLNRIHTKYSRGSALCLYNEHLHGSVLGSLGGKSCD